MPENKSLRGCDICHLKPCVKTGEEQRYCFVRYLIVETLPDEHWVKKRKESQK